jgi:class 3 adenylate cyclase
VESDALRQVLQSLAEGVAVVDPETGAVAFENARFFQWFPPEALERDPDAVADPTVVERVPGFDLERARSRAEGGRHYELELEVKLGNRTVPLRLRTSRLGEDEVEGIVVEAVDASKQREAEYMLESYSRLAERNARELEKEKEKVERLLLNIMPKSVFEEMRDYGTATPQHFESASIVMLDFVGFTKMAIANDAHAVIAELNDIFSAFDRIVDMFGCERLRTIGDAYMAVSGVPEATPEHAQNAARAALRMRRYIEKRNAAHPQQWQARIGINTGPVIGSLVGVQKYVYDLFGPGVNLAARMEALSEPMMITVNEETHDLLKDDFSFTERGEFEVKGFGTQRLYFLDGQFGERI